MTRYSRQPDGWLQPHTLYCETCGSAFTRNTYPSGGAERMCHFTRRKCCSNRCHLARVHRQRRADTRWWRKLSQEYVAA